MARSPTNPKKAVGWQLHWHVGLNSPVQRRVGLTLVMSLEPQIQCVSCSKPISSWVCNRKTFLPWVDWSISRTFQGVRNAGRRSAYLNTHGMLWFEVCTDSSNSLKSVIPAHPVTSTLKDALESLSSIWVPSGFHL